MMSYLSSEEFSYPNNGFHNSSSSPGLPVVTPKIETTTQAVEPQLYETGAQKNSLFYYSHCPRLIWKASLGTMFLAILLFGLSV